MRRYIRLATAALASAALTVAAGPIQAASAAEAMPSPQLIRTIGRPGHAGVYAWGMATATDGSILVGDYWNHRVLRYGTTGKLLATMSSKGTALGQNMGPHGLAVDERDGSFYIADMNGPQKIAKFDRNGKGLWSIRPFVPGVTSPYPYVTRLAVDSTSLVYLVNSHNVSSSPGGFQSNILVYSPDGTFVRSFGSNGREPGTFALLRGIDIDANDNVYIADAGQGLVQVWSKDGRYLRSFGKGLFPGDMRGVTIDDARGLVYVADTAGGQIEKFRLDGTHVQSFASRGAAPGQLGDGPRDFAIDARGRVFASDFGNTRVNVYDTAGTFLFHFPNPATPARKDGFNQAEDVAVNAAGTQVWTADTFNHRVQRWSATGNVSTVWGFRGNTQPQALAYPRGIAVDPRNGDIWVNNSRYGDIKRYRPDGTLVTRFASWGTGPSNLNLSRGITVSTNGVVYVTDSNNRQLKAFTETGRLLWSVPCGGPFVPGSMALLQGCTGVVRDAAGFLYAAAPTEHAIYKFASDGTKVATWGRQGNAAGQLNRPYDVALWNGRLYVSEMVGQRISAFTTGGAYVGRFGTGGTEPGKLKTPAGLSIDRNGTLYVAELGNERISVFKLP
jgi:tripartite motif-containing protein 71